LITKQSDLFRKSLYANMPKIQKALEGFVAFIFKAFEGIVHLGETIWSVLTRVYDFFKRLDDATNGWSTIILAVIAAWKLLNLSFLASPLGMLLALGAAILLLYDDYKTFKEGGKALLDWNNNWIKALGITVGAIGAVVAAFFAWGEAMKFLTTVQKILTATVEIFEGVMTALETIVVVITSPIFLIAAAIGALITALTLADAKWQIFGGHLSGFFNGIGSKIADFFSGSNVLQNIIGNPAASPQPNPVSHISNNATSQNVNLQTNINIAGAADATSVGQSVGNAVSRSNQQTLPILKGATR